jgi:hypothetical protein
MGIPEEERTVAGDIDAMLEERVKVLETKLIALVAYLDRVSQNQFRGQLTPEMAELMTVLDGGKGAQEFYQGRVVGLSR